MLSFPKLQYITQSMPLNTQEEFIYRLCEAGVRWVQLRDKNSDAFQVLRHAKVLRRVCDLFGATFIINDYVEIAKDCRACGVHLGKEDADPRTARRILGPNAIIGGSANTLADVMRLLRLGVDYIGLGPFGYTETKRRLSPVLKLCGVSEIIRNAQASTPIFAIGGIQVEDVPSLLNAGVYGVAVSSAIFKAQAPLESVKNFNRSLDGGMYGFSADSE